MKQEPEEIDGELREIVSLLQPEELQHLVTAQGYVELGMLSEARAELKNINPEIQKEMDGAIVTLEVHFRIDPALGAKMNPFCP